MITNDELKQLTDSELLDLLDSVSSEISNRNSLNSLLKNDVDEQYIKRATDYLCQVMSQNMSQK